MEAEKRQILQLTAQIVTHYVGRNAVAADQLASFICCVNAALCEMSKGGTPSYSEPQPPGSIRRSINTNYLVCFEDGQRFKLLKRHLRTKYGLTPDEYRAKWGLPNDYPMVAPSYAKARSKMAKTSGLGRRVGTVASGKNPPAEGR